MSQPNKNSNMPTNLDSQDTDVIEGGNPSDSKPSASGLAQVAKTRAQNPNIDQDSLQALVSGNCAFGLNLYQILRESGEDNLFFSPYSISLALAMAYSGARGETAQEIAETLHFSLSEGLLHAGFNALDLEITNRDNKEDETIPGFKLNVVNSAWVQYDRPFEQAYLELLAENYGAGLSLTDYAKDPEEARMAINAWVSDETNGKIEELIPAGAINALTRLVLVNAIYFNASWQITFKEDQTAETTFTLADGSQKLVPMMSTVGSERFGYAIGDNYQIVELPYHGGQLSMILILPDEGTFDAFESSLDVDQLAEVLKDIQIKQVELQMPKFSFESEFELVGMLRLLGIQAAFDQQNADFSGIDGTKELSISHVFHKAFVLVDEKGTEAAAASAVLFRLRSIPVTDVQIAIDRPFIFLIQDKPTGTVLFLGRVLDPLP
jgi:serpin B